MLNYSVESKSQLAKLLATENIKIEHANAPTAAFNLKTRTLICPIWKDMTGDMYDLLLGHEVSHALETPEQGWHNAVCDKGINYRHFLNVVEDARIEKKIKRRYPGIRRSFINAYKQLLEQDFFGIADEDRDKMFFIDRLNVHCKAGISAGIKFKNDEEKRLLNLVEDAETWNDVLEATRQVWEYSKEEQQQIPQKVKTTYYVEVDDADESDSTEFYPEDDDFDFDDEDANDSNSSDSDSKEDADADSDDASDSQDKGDTDADSEEGEKSDTTPDSAEADGEDEDKQSESNQSQHNPDQDDSDQDDSDQDTFGDPKCVTDENFRENEYKLLSEEIQTYTYITIPKLKTPSMIVTHSEINQYMTTHFATEPFDLNKLYNNFKEKNAQYISLLVKEFEMKKAAKAFNRSKLADTGDIDVNKIYKYQLDDQIFRKAMIVPKGKSHGLVLLLDMSGSMSDNIDGSIEQILVLTSFCKKVNIPFTVYGFSASSSDKEVNDSFVQKRNTLQFGKFKLIEFMSSKMKSNEFLTAIKNMCGLAHAFGNNRYVPSQLQLGRTPLTESVITLQPIIKQFKKNNNLDIVNLVVVHDGDADSVNTYASPGEYSQKISGYSNEKYVLRDDEENLDFQIPNKNDKNLGENIRNAVFEWFAKTTGTKIFGFFITGATKNQINNALWSRYVDPNKTFSTYSDKYAYYDQKTAELKKEKWVVSKTPGYESFFLIVGGSNLKTENEELVVTGSVNKKSLTTALRRLTKNRVSNRVLVSKFIEGIAV